MRKLWGALARWLQRLKQQHWDEQLHEYKSPLVFGVYRQDPPLRRFCRWLGKGLQKALAKGVWPLLFALGTGVLSTLLVNWLGL